MDQLIITAAIVGSRPMKSMNPAVPYKPEEIAREAIASWRAGAAIVHIHVRDPESGAPSMDIGLFQEVVSFIREQSDVLINLTTSGFHLKGDHAGERRLLPLDLKPEICSFDIGSLNFKDEAFINPPAWGEMAARRMKEAGIKPEIEVFEVGHIHQARAYVNEELIKEPAYFQLCMGGGWGIEVGLRRE
jgi:3-keto-5-aminohexanoate cleavage enzyme